MLQQVATLAGWLGGYLNYPSALIRQPGERRGRQAERERSWLELGGLWPARCGWAGACLRRGRKEEEGGEGVLLPLRSPVEGCLRGRALQSQALGRSPCPGERLAQGWVFMPLAGASKGQTLALPGAPILTHPSAPSTSPLGEDARTQGSAKPASFPKPAQKMGPV